MACIGPLMIREAMEPRLKSALNHLSQIKNHERLEEEKKPACHAASNSHISQDEFQTIEVELRGLKSIARNDKARSVEDSGTYWTLTPYGDGTMTQLCALQRNEDDEVPSTEIVSVKKA